MIKEYAVKDLFGIGYGYDINSVNPLYLCIDNANGYIEEKMEINT